MFFATGIIFLGLVVAAYALYHYMKESGRKTAWWKWLLTAIWVIALFLVAFVIGTFSGEGMPQAILPASLFFGILLLIPGIILWRLLFSETFLPRKK